MLLEAETQERDQDAESKGCRWHTISSYLPGRKTQRERERERESAE